MVLLQSLYFSRFLQNRPSPPSSFDSHVRWQPVTQSARSRQSYQTIGNCEQSNKPLNYLSSDLTQCHEFLLKERLESSVPSCKAANFRFLFTTFRRSAFLLLKLSIITYGTIGDFIVSSKLSMTTCTENTNMY